MINKVRMVLSIIVALCLVAGLVLIAFGPVYSAIVLLVANLVQQRLIEIAIRYKDDGKLR